LARERWAARLGGPEGTAFAAWTLIALQDAPVHAANFYTGDVQMFGLFDMNGVPRKNFHAFRAFRALLDTPRRVGTPPSEPGQVAVCAGLDPSNTRGAVLLANFNAPGRTWNLVLRGLPWTTATRYEVLRVDAAHDLETVGKGSLSGSTSALTVDMPAPAVGLVRLEKAAESN
jgi:hypothetical protein